MSTFVSGWRLSHLLLLAFSCLLVLAGSAQAKPKVPPPYSWNLAADFPLTAQNAAPDKYGDKNIWFYSQSNGHEPSTKYAKMKTYVGPAEEEASCGVKGFHVWEKRHSTNGTPGIVFNAGPTVEEGETSCAPHARFAANTVFMSPEFLGDGHASVVRWHSIVTGNVTVSGSVQLVDSFPSKGIRWELDNGVTPVVGPFEEYGTSLMSFGPVTVPVVKGNYLNLVVRPAAAATGAFDSTAVSLTISYP